MADGKENPEPNLIVRFARRMRRGWRRLKRRFTTPKVRFVYHDAYGHILDSAPMDPTRGQKILGFLVDEGLLDREDLSVPRKPSKVIAPGLIRSCIFCSCTVCFIRPLFSVYANLS